MKLNTRQRKYVDYRIAKITAELEEIKKRSERGESRPKDIGHLHWCSNMLGALDLINRLDKMGD